MACQVRTSYICNEILWGHRFEPAISRYPKFGGYQVDYNKIDKTYEVRKKLLFSDAKLPVLQIKPEMSGQSAEERDNDDEYKLEDSEVNEEIRNDQYLDTVKTVC